MSVEDVQKVNELAQELMSKGFATDREEAVKKAQEMLNKEITGNEIKTEETDSRQNIAAAGENEENIRNMVERTKEYVERQLAGYKNALLALEKELKSLHQQVEELKARGISHAKPEPKDPEEEPLKVDNQDPAEEPQKVEEHPKQESNGESNPRTGSHKSDDVSIEKMFYYGNK